MIGGKKPQGYTIIEVMLFLVITATLFVSAMAVFQGRQGRTEFSQGIREVDSHLRTIINETVSGYYPSTPNFGCTATGGNAGPSVSAVGGTEQGKKTDCIFLGKVVHFGTSGSDCTPGSTSNCNQYSVYTVIGQRQFTVSGAKQEVSSLAQAVPTAVVKRTGDPVNQPDLTETSNIPNGLHVTRVRVVTSSGTLDTSGIGFISSLASYGAGGDLVSGSQNIDMIPVTNLPLGSDKDAAATRTRALTDASRRPQRVVVCFEGDDSKKAAITIGGSGRQLSTDVTFEGDVPAECN